MREPLVVAVVQPVCVAHDVATNAETHAATVRAAGARVVVFPELSLTGYELDAEAITADDVRLAPIVEACADVQAVALVGAPVEGAGGRPHIAMLAIDSDGCTVVYRKVWLGAREAERFAPGDGPAVYEVDGWRLGLAVCRDTGVPRHAADTAALGMDAYVAGVARSPDEIPEREERTRRVALTHRVWVAVASFAGSTGGGYAPAAGRSGVWAPDGSVVAQAGPEAGAVTSATLVNG